MLDPKAPHAWLRRYPRRGNTARMLWAGGMLACLLVAGHLAQLRTGLLIPPFGATLSLLVYLPEQPVSQPLPVVGGSTLGAVVGSLGHLWWPSPWMAGIVAAALLLLLPRVGLYHPPAIALAIYTELLHPAFWFPWLVVFPFTALAVTSYALCARYTKGTPYPGRATT
ncbi:MAG: HPP family protein [Firmicutes bacterium]|nr:HPP family protein [Bacillota bacterium]